MKMLIDKIKREGVYLGKGIIKVDGFINHQIEPDMMVECGKAFVEAFRAAGVPVDNVTKVLTAEVSGISPAFAVGLALGVPMVFARKHRPITMQNSYYLAEAPSRTKQNMVEFAVSKQYLNDTDTLLLIDDFLAKGFSVEALVKIIRQSGASLLGIGCVIEKVFEPGRKYLEERVDVPVISLAKIDLAQNDTINVF